MRPRAGMNLAPFGTQCVGQGFIPGFKGVDPDKGVPPMVEGLGNGKSLLPVIPVQKRRNGIRKTCLLYTSRCV